MTNLISLDVIARLPHVKHIGALTFGEALETIHGTCLAPKDSTKINLRVGFPKYFIESLQEIVHLKHGAMEWVHHPTNSLEFIILFDIVYKLPMPLVPVGALRNDQIVNDFRRVLASPYWARTTYTTDEIYKYLLGVQLPYGMPHAMRECLVYKLLDDVSTILQDLPIECPYNERT